MHNQDHSMKNDFDINFPFALTRTYATIISRWGGSGHHVIMGCNFQNENSEDYKHSCKFVLEKRDPIIIPFLNVLSFSTIFLRAAWTLVQSDPQIKKEVEALLEFKRG